MKDKEDIIELTVALYRVTARFPENEALSRKIREKANDVLVDFIYLNPSFNAQAVENVRISKDIEILLALFSVAESQNWVNKKNFAVLRREYSQIREEIKNFIPKKTQKSTKIAKKDKKTEIIRETEEKKALTKGPSARQKKIVELIESKGKVSLAEFREIFSYFSPRTLRRDLKNLVNKGVIRKIRTGKEDISFVLSEGINSGHILDS